MTDHLAPPQATGSSVRLSHGPTKPLPPQPTANVARPLRFVCSRRFPMPRELNPPVIPPRPNLETLHTNNIISSPLPNDSQTHVNESPASNPPVITPSSSPPTPTDSNVATSQITTTNGGLRPNGSSPDAHNAASASTTPHPVEVSLAPSTSTLPSPASTSSSTSSSTSGSSSLSNSGFNMMGSGSHDYSLPDGGGIKRVVPKLADGREPTRRDYIAFEMLETERTYVFNMHTLIQSFLKPLKAGKQTVDQPDDHHLQAVPDMKPRSGTLGIFARRGPTAPSNTPVLEEEQIATIFSNIEEILNLNQMLLVDLEERMKNWTDKTCIGDIFVEFIFPSDASLLLVFLSKSVQSPYLKKYVIYAIKSEKAQELMLGLENNKAWIEFIRSWETLESISPANLRSFLILPIQRIPRYELFLKELVKFTEPTHPDYAKLEKAYEEVRQVNHKINESIREANNRLKLIEIQRSFIDTLWGASIPTLIEPHRLFIKEGPLVKICRSKHTQRWVFLFNDMLIYASEFVGNSVSSHKRFQFHKHFMLSTLRVDDLPDRETGQKIIRNAFKIVTPNKSFVLYALSAEDKTEWLRIINAAITAWSVKRSTLSQRASADPAAMVEAPVWIPDDEVVACMIPTCSQLFGFTKRRHHCRSCGKVVCSDCSRRKHRLLNVDREKPVRVCDVCYDRLSSPLAAGSTTVSQKPPTTSPRNAQLSTTASAATTTSGHHVSASLPTPSSVSGRQPSQETITFSSLDSVSVSPSTNSSSMSISPGTTTSFSQLPVDHHPTPSTQTLSSVGDAVKKGGAEYVALYDFKGENELELTFKAGARLHVAVDEEVDGWLEGELNGRFGFIPTNYVKRAS